MSSGLGTIYNSKGKLFWTFRIRYFIVFLIRIWFKNINHLYLSHCFNFDWLDRGYTYSQSGWAISTSILSKGLPIWHCCNGVFDGSLLIVLIAFLKFTQRNMFRILSRIFFTPRGFPIIYHHEVVIFQTF